jgi:hypothetical protein
MANLLRLDRCRFPTLGVGVIEVLSAVYLLSHTAGTAGHTEDATRES